MVESLLDGIADRDLPVTSELRKAEPYRDNIEYLQDRLELLEEELRAWHRWKKVRNGKSDGTEMPQWMLTDSPDGNGGNGTSGTQTPSRPDDPRRWLDDRFRRRVAASARAGFVPAFEQLANRFALDGFERKTLLTVFAYWISYRFRDLWHRTLDPAEQNPYMHSLGIGPVLRFICRDFREELRARRYFKPDATLVREELLHVDIDEMRNSADLLSVDLKLSQRVQNEMLGQEDTDLSLVIFSRLERPEATLEQVVLPPEQTDEVLSFVDHFDAYVAKRRELGLDQLIGYGLATTLLFTGPPGTGKTLLARAIANRLSRPLLVVDTTRFRESRESSDAILRRLFREARMQQAVLFFDECDSLFVRRGLGASETARLLTELERLDGLAVFATNLPEVLDPALNRRILLRLHLDTPDAPLREQIWRQHITPAVPLSDDVDFRELAEAFPFSGGYIKNAVLAALASATRRVDGPLMLRQSDFVQAAHMQLRTETCLKGMVETYHPRSDLSRLVLSPNLQREIGHFLSACQSHQTVLRRLRLRDRFPNGQGLKAALHGPPGTGKTMAAEAIAHALGRPLCRVLVGGVLSKYVGETEENIRTVLAEARGGESVLFFDEADALMAGRVAVHSSLDRFANSEVSVLLEELERSDGIVLAATNCAEEIDDAFYRRFQFHLHFERPGPAEQQRLWRTLADGLVDLSDVDLVAAVRRHAMTGGEIKNAILRLVYAKPLTDRVSRPSQQELEAVQRSILRVQSRPTVGFGRGRC